MDYDNDEERRHTHPLLMPKVDDDQISVADGKVLEKLAIFKSVKPVRTKPRVKGILRDITNR